MRNKQKWIRIIVWVTVAGMVLTLFAGVAAMFS